MANLKDPVAQKTQQIQEKKDDEELKTFDISNLKLDDFKPLETRAASTPHPFEGYPKKMVKVGTFGLKKSKDLMMPAYAVVALNPKEVVPKDPSGRAQSIRDARTGRERIVDIYAPHNRCVVDYDNGGINVDVCFDREIELDGGHKLERCAFVESHSARAQIMFTLDRTGDRIQVDRRYLLLDTDQSSRLRRVFEIIVNPKIKKERLAKAISGESDEDLDSIPED